MEDLCTKVLFVQKMISSISTPDILEFQLKILVSCLIQIYLQFSADMDKLLGFNLLHFGLVFGLDFYLGFGRRRIGLFVHIISII